MSPIRPAINLLTGMPLSENGGTARFLNRLREEYECDSDPGFDARFLSHVGPFKKYNKKPLNKLDKVVPVDAHHAEKFRDIENLILFHPQALGYRFTTRLLKSRKHTWHFALDSSFFCRRSYNHIAGENNACLRCLHEGQAAASKQGCSEFPWEQGGAAAYVNTIQELGDSISWLAQSHVTAQLLRELLGKDVRVEVLGMAADFNTAEAPKVGPPKHRQLVFHGHALDAKGFWWAVQLAAHMPEWNFLFPFSKGALQGREATPNCVFEVMNWESGLREAIENSAGSLNPSLWSAPIEGAFAKSVLHGHSVIFIDIPSAATSSFAADPACIRVDQDPKKAAAVLNGRLGGAIDQTTRSKRLETMRQFVGAESETSQIGRMAEFVLSGKAPIT